MSDDPARSASTVARDQLRHDLISPLAVISGRAQLLARVIQRSPSPTEMEQSTVLDGLATIEAAVRALVTRIDVYSREDGTGDIRHAVIAAPEPQDPAR